jgi:pimeloyl-ACP methyl ester carboxylesterase
MTSPGDITHLHHLVHLPSRSTALITYPSSDLLKRPVLLVHGVHSAPGHLDLWRHRCEDAGLSPYCFAYPTKGSIQGITAAVTATLRDLHANHNTGVTLVGHSLGGIIAASAALEVASTDPSAVSLVVAVCSPFDGATLAKASFLGPSRHLLHDLCRGSQFLTDLKAHLGEAATVTRWVSIGLQHDGVVSEESAKLPHPRAHHVTLGGENHLSALISSAVADEIVGVLTTESSPNGDN